ncbi:hypothetical protein IV102_33935 [bacterium]|nr:hypothetical protein [bacterium]
MTFELLPGVLGPESFAGDLIALLNFARDGRHWVVPGPGLSLDGWIQALPESLRAEVSFALDLSLEQEARSPHFLRVQVDGPGARPPAISLQESLQRATAPLEVILENIESDLAFLEAVVPPDYRDQMEEMRSKRWIDFVHGGGSNLPAVLRHRLENSRASQRHFVFFDSDALTPNQPSKKANDLVDQCLAEQPPVAHHFLQRREIENYLPLPALQNWALQRNKRERRKKLESFKALSPNQKHHFDLKRGFRGKNDSALFADLESRHRDPLAMGFGDKIWEWFQNIDFDWLDRDGQRAELMELFSKLWRLR